LIRILPGDLWLPGRDGLMAVILLDRRGLARSLQPLGQHQRGAFAASCAQRLAPGFLDSPAVRVERSDDLQLAQGLLTELWAAAASGTAGRLGPSVRAVERLPELTAQEEWEGRGAYQTDALAALLYAGRSWQPSPTNYVVGCAQRAFDTAAFLDRQLAPVPEADSLGDLRALIEHGIPLPDPPSGPFQPRELRRQREDLAAITAAEPATWEAVLAQMRQASAAYAREFLAALESVFDAR
jgi:hypothetical protein